MASAAVPLLLSACGVGEPAADLAGGCSVREPGGTTRLGTAAYAVHATPTAGGGFGTGSLALTIACSTQGLARDEVVLILPNLVRGAQPPPGAYRVRDPADPTLSPADLVDPRLAWVRVQRGEARPLLLPGEAGRVVLTRVTPTFVEGAYQVAVARADSAVVLPGARPEVAGPVASDSTGRPVVSRTVLEGAFVAPLAEADWRGP